MTNTNKTALLLAVVSLSAALACSKDEPSSEARYAQPAASQGDEATPPEARANTPGVTAEPPTPAMPAMVSPNTPPPGAALSDAQIAKVTDTVDAAEIDQAQLATTRASDARVKRFAAHMIEQHTQAKREASDLATQAHITPAASDDSSELEHKTQKVLDDLRSATSTAFDKQYIDAQVKQHQDVLDALNSKLIPSATNADLAALLKKVRGMVQTHLADAKAIQKAL